MVVWGRLGCLAFQGAGVSLEMIPQARKNWGLCSPSTNQTEERVEANPWAKPAEISFCLISFGGCGGSSQIHQEKCLFFMSYEGGIWKRIYCHRDLIQTESLGPVPRSLHSVSGQHYSRLPCELEGGEEAATCQLQNVTLTPPCTTSQWTPALPSPFYTPPPTPIKHNSEKQSLWA